MSRLDEFKEFVKKHPLLKDEVSSHRKTWQELYEDWVIIPTDSSWEKYERKEERKEEKKEEKDTKTDDFMKNILGYVKKIDPDKITKYVGSIQKIIELLGVFGGGATVASQAKSKTRDPLFDRSLDEWY